MDLRWLGQPTASGLSVSEESAQRQATVFACIDILSRDMASLPMRLVERSPNGGRREITDHPVARWLKRPNTVMTWKNYRVQGWIWHQSWGNEFSQIRRNGAGEIETWPLDSSRMKVRSLDNGRKEFEYRRTDGTTRKIPAQAVLHNFGYTTNGLWGISPIQMCMETVGHAQALELYGAKSFDDPVPRIIFTRDIDFKDEASIESFLARWREKFSTFSGRGERAAVTPKGMKPEILKIPNTDAQFVESRKMQKQEIAQIFHVPLHRLMDMENSHYNNIEHSGIEYVQFGLLPNLVGYEQTLEMALLSADERETMSIKHNVDGLLRGDYKTRIDGNKAAIESGQLLPNEARAMEEREPIEGGDRAYFPSNFGPLGQTPAPTETPVQK